MASLYAGKRVVNGEWRHRQQMSLRKPPCSPSRGPVTKAESRREPTVTRWWQQSLGKRVLCLQLAFGASGVLSREQLPGRPCRRGPRAEASIDARRNAAGTPRRTT
ncbi:hypothetical protein TcG_09688 [Trypanosoma cruzi]|nr:hypothetical protein TcG_09688 [Trypanosoma cruzi]